MSVIGARYSEALVLLAENETVMKEYRASLSFIGAVFSENPQLDAFFDSPLISGVEKKQVIRNVFTGEPPEILNLLYLLVDRKRMNVFMEIKNAFNNDVNRLLNIQEGVVYSVSLLSKEQLEAIQEAFSKKLKKQVLLINKVDDDLISGVRVEIGEKVFDGSLQKEIQTLRDILQG